ncbi:hypothetical protein SAMN05444279_1466 [Ruegeria intermedia]|uniref:Uncharacterized protein n=1 Tax=Ruegeria intermedia TaxID=996115 RepID=A0A1M5BP51_9RHOB|nr:hypothetical protein [Ruegeria intermedia]SHF44211.1 hypothetical protein SAMN05444279_1466 [Ruegeria intermedia]
MNSILGPSLQAEKTAVVMRRLERLERIKDRIRRKTDRMHIERMVEDRRILGADFIPSDWDASKLAEIECRLVAAPKFSRLQDACVEKAKAIIKNGSLESGKLLQLVALVEKAEARPLTKSEIDRLQNLVLLARDRRPKH